MGWARFDDRWPTHPKLLAAGLAAKGLDASGICYAAGQETDGFIPDSALPILAGGHRNPKKVADVLVSVDRWSRDEERKGYIIHDYLDYNPTHESREAERVEKRRAGRLGGQRSGEARRRPTGEAEAKQSASTRTKQSASSEPQAERSRQVELPSRPVPSLSSSSVLNHQTGPMPPGDDERILQVAAQARSLIGDRRMAASTAPISNPRAYRSTVLRDVEAEMGNELRAMACNGLSADAIADALEPPPAATVSPYPAVGDSTEPVWDEVTDEHGHLVVVPRRSA